MPISVKMLEKLLLLTGWSFENAKDRPEVNEKIIEYKYDAPRLDALLNLNGRLDTAYQYQQEKRAEQVIAYRNFDEKYREERKECRNLRSLVKKVIPPDKFEKYSKLLGLDERLKKPLEGFDEQARKLYNNIKPDEWLLGLLAKFGVTVEKILPRFVGLTELKRLHKVRETAKALSQAARRDRDILYKELRKEWADFKDICDMAFEDKENPQYKELVGILEPSEGYVRKKKEEEPAAQEPQMN
jgi:hypothetical protein